MIIKTWFWEIGILHENDIWGMTKIMLRLSFSSIMRYDPSSPALLEMMSSFLKSQFHQQI